MGRSLPPREDEERETERKNKKMGFWRNNAGVLLCGYGFLWWFVVALSVAGGAKATIPAPLPVSYRERYDATTQISDRDASPTRVSTKREKNKRKSAQREGGSKLRGSCAKFFHLFFLSLPSLSVSLVGNSEGGGGGGDGTHLGSLPLRVLSPPAIPPRCD